MIHTKKLPFIVFILLFLVHEVVFAQTIKSILIEGNKKISKEAIASKIQSKVGRPYSKTQVSKDVENIFKTGHFYDIEVYNEKGVLRYVVVERPLVTEIAFEGNRKIKSDELFEILEFKQNDFLDVSKINSSLDKMIELYESKGFFLASISYEVESKNKEGVELVFNVSENKKVKIKKINIRGNEAISDDVLKSNMISKERTFFSFISGGGRYSEAGFERDLQVIKYLYYNEGYIQAQVKSSQVFISPNKKDLIIDIEVEEGSKHTVGQINFSGDMLFTIDEHFQEIRTGTGEAFAYDVLQNDLSRLQAMYGDLGYAFVDIIPETKVDQDSKVVDLNFAIDIGEKVYFGKFDIVGNQSTRDKVIRREMNMIEGNLYNETAKRESLANIKRLGFFEDVIFGQKVDAEDPTKVNYDIKVEERSTGTLQVGAGYGSFSGLLFNGRVEKTNLFGRGQSLSLTATLSGIEKFYTLSFTEPYLLDTKWSFGLDLYNTNYIIQDQYEDFRTGGAIRLGHPLAPYLYGFIKYSYEHTQIEPRTLFKREIFRESDAEGNVSAVTFSLDFDKRNDRWMPTDGLFTSASLKLAGLGGDKKFSETAFNARFYQPIWKNLVIRNNFTYSVLSPYGDQEEIAFNELYRLGGVNTLRGFRWYGIGTTVKDDGGNDVVKGGTHQAYYNLELQLPLIQKTGMFGVVFYDIGMAENMLELDMLRSNIGIGIRWFSPMGPLRFEWGFPIDRRAGEDRSQFQFSIGAPF